MDLAVNTDVHSAFRHRIAHPLHSDRATDFCKSLRGGGTLKCFAFRSQFKHSAFLSSLYTETTRGLCRTTTLSRTSMSTARGRSRPTPTWTRNVGDGSLWWRTTPYCTATSTTRTRRRRRHRRAGGALPPTVRPPPSRSLRVCVCVCVFGSIHRSDADAPSPVTLSPGSRPTQAHLDAG